MALEFKKKNTNLDLYYKDSQSGSVRRQIYCENLNEPMDDESRNVIAVGELSPFNKKRSMPDLLQSVKLDKMPCLHEETIVERKKSPSKIIQDKIESSRNRIKLNLQTTHSIIAPQQPRATSFNTPNLKSKEAKVKGGLDSLKLNFQPIGNIRINQFILNYQQKLGIQNYQQTHELDRLKSKVKEWKKKQDTKNKKQIETLTEESPHRQQKQFLARVQDSSQSKQNETATYSRKERQQLNSKFQSQNVSAMSEMSTCPTNPTSHDHHQKIFVKQFNEQEGRLLNRLEDGIKLNGENSFIHNTLKNLYRRTSIYENSDIHFNSSTTNQDSSATPSPSKASRKQTDNSSFSQKNLSFFTPMELKKVSSSRQLFNN